MLRIRTLFVNYSTTSDVTSVSVRRITGHLTIVLVDSRGRSSATRRGRRGVVLVELLMMLKIVDHLELEVRVRRHLVEVLMMLLLLLQEMLLVKRAVCNRIIVVRRSR